MKIRPTSLFGRTALTIGFVLLLFTLVSMSAIVYFVMVPMAKRSAEDFAAEFVSKNMLILLEHVSTRSRCSVKVLATEFLHCESRVGV